MKNYYIIIFTLLLYFKGHAQPINNPDKAIGLEYFTSFIFEHKPQITHLITNHPTGFRLIYNRKTHGDALWEQRYNFPDRGFTFIYMNYHNNRLGKTLALLPHYAFYLRKNREAKYQPQFKMGFGIGYTTEKYDPVTNNQNNVLSTDLSGAVLFQFGQDYRISPTFTLNSSVSVTHFSNGAIKKPNSGINIFGANFGIHYTVDYHGHSFKYIEDQPLAKKPIGYSFILIGGMHEALQVSSGSKPFFVFSGIIDKQLSHKYRMGLGLEWFHSESLKEEIKYDQNVDPNTNATRIGLVLSNEIMIEKYAIIPHVGYYLYDPYHAFQKIYFRLKLRRYFGQHLFGSIGVKSHSARAEAMEFGIGYRVK